MEVTNTYPGGYWEDRGFNWHAGCRGAVSHLIVLTLVRRPNV